MGESGANKHFVPNSALWIEGVSVTGVGSPLRTYSNYGWLTSDQPINSSQADLHLPMSSQHVGGAHFLFCDGSVKFLSENVDKSAYDALFTKAGNDATGGLP